MSVIETIYDRYRFRSRLEARWAVFFNYLHIPYQYEKEGYEWKGIGRYLPDFFLPTIGSRSAGSIWLEVKPPNYKETKYDTDRYSCLVKETKHTLVLARGLPPVSANTEDLCDEFVYCSAYDDISWDSPMVFIKCYKCGAMRFEFSEGNYMQCGLCSTVSTDKGCNPKLQLADDNHPTLLAALEAAKQARF